MATFTWYCNNTAGSTVAVSSNHVVFSSSATDLSLPVTVGSFQDGTHLGNGHPGTDQCGANHIMNVKYISSTQFQLNGGSTETINNTNLAATETTLKIEFNDVASVGCTNTRFYAFDGATTTAYSPGIDAYAVEAQVGSTDWKKINDGSAAQGGDNSTYHLDLVDQTTPATTHTWFVAMSVSPESVGGKSQFDAGIALTYS